MAEPSPDEDEGRYVLPAEDRIEVYATKEGLIAIAQDNHVEAKADVVVVSPLRLQRLILMMQAVEKEILERR